MNRSESPPKRRVAWREFVQSHHLLCVYLMIYAISIVVGPAWTGTLGRVQA